ncbi:hypothetical protein NIES4103_00090 [Nostoc sp. NIES-4103]|nr:hypothetical protein NIES4103_00090 [Nostoc sp. NIES-4103]
MQIGEKITHEKCHKLEIITGNDTCGVTEYGRGAKEGLG